MSQAELAHRAGLSINHVKQIVRSKVPITTEVARRLARVTCGPRGERSGSADLDVLGVLGEGTQIRNVGCQHRAAGLGASDDDRVHGRSSTGQRAQSSRPSRDLLRQDLDDLAVFEESVDGGVGSLATRHALRQNHRGHQRRPDPVPDEHLDQSRRAPSALRQRGDASGVQDERRHRSVSPRRMTRDRASAAARSSAEGSPTSLISSSR